MSYLEMLDRNHGTDKVEHGYLSIYEKMFNHIKNDKNNILEIGVWRGSSLSLWSEYFKNSYITENVASIEYYSENSKGAELAILHKK